MRRRQMDLYIGVFLVAMALLSLIGVFDLIGVSLSQKFFNIVMVIVGIYLIVMGVKK